MICGLAFACALIAASGCPPDTNAGITRAVAPEYPDTARYDDVPPTMVLAEVTVGADGKPLNAQVLKSSGRPDLDGETLRAARLSQYSAKVVNCHPVIGEYLFHAEYWPDTDLSRFLVAPSFAAPAAWTRNPHATAASGFKQFNEWTSGNDVIGTMAAFSRSYLPAYVLQKTQDIEKAQASVTSSEQIMVCNGKSSGWKLEYVQGATHYVEVLQMVDYQRLYDAYYYGQEAPSKEVSDSLMSLCASTS